ncbi:senescence-associated protein [Dunaliella salina]|uniref:Senescence-associated protein n=1 Tax=Dunaliella salina TaxID=3046 RepID=A0ABQ7GMF9_DUNSA|nr:senescence-associated protein [Dunaliella salina]|eukprot:KAF5835802.1 senescence-associated protein [Dunaliella salina]
MNAWLPQASYPCCFYPFVLHEISVIVELILGHLRYSLTDVPPQPNSPPDNRVVHPRLVEFLHFDIQSTGQKSHCVNILKDYHNALF